jgi:replicative DNA helicase
MTIETKAKPDRAPLEWHEEAVIGGVLNWPEDGFPSVVRMLEPEHFEHGSNPVIWTAIAELMGKGDPIDPVSVYGKLVDHGHKGHGHYLVTASGSALTANTEYHAKIVWESGQQRMLKRRIDDIVDRSSGGSFDEVAGGVLDAVRSVERVCGSSGPVHIREPLRDAMSRLEKLSIDPDAFRVCGTGLSDLDDQLLMEAGAVTVVAARPGMGKTALAAGMARECARDITRGSVCMFSLEMSAVSLVVRLVSRESRVETKALTDTRHQPAVSAAVDRLWRSGLYFDDRANISTTEMSQALKQLGKVRLVVVDYLQLAKMDGDGDRHDIRIGQVMKGLKAISKENACHVIVLSQLNRNVEKRNPPIPQISDLRDSGNIEEDADNILFIYRNDYYPNPDPNRRGVADVIIAKQRNGPQGTVELTWIPTTQTFANLSRSKQR